LLHLWVVVGIVGLVVAGLTIAVIIPRVHHLKIFDKRYISILESNQTPTICCDFYFPLFKRRGHGQGAEAIP
jgi:hypothetical protein